MAFAVYIGSAAAVALYAMSGIKNRAGRPTTLYAMSGTDIGPSYAVVQDGTQGRIRTCREWYCDAVRLHPPLHP
eukprot:3019592-Rhodomonas_salina.1